MKHLFFIFSICGLFSFLLLACSKKVTTTTSATPHIPVYDTQAIATVINPQLGDGDYDDALPAHSVLAFSVNGYVHQASSCRYYGMFLEKGEKFVIRYNSVNPKEYDIRFDEPVFTPSQKLVRTVGGVVSVYAVDSSNGFGQIEFIYEVNTDKRDHSGDYYVRFKSKYQCIRQGSPHPVKWGGKYVVYYDVDNPSLAILYPDQVVDSIHTRENYLFYNAEETLPRYKRFIKLMTKTLDINPYNDYARYARGKAYYQLDKNRKAERDFAQYIQNHPDTYDGYWFRALIRMKRSEYQLALDDIEKAIWINPDSEPDLYYYQGILYFYLKDYARSVESFTRAIQIDSEKGKYYYDRAVAEVKKSGSKTSGSFDYEKARDLGIRKSKRMMKRSHPGRHDILVQDIKKPWSRFYSSLTTETGTMPCRINAASASIGLPYQIQDRKSKALISAGYFQHTYNFPRMNRAFFTAWAIEVGNPVKGYFVTRIAPVWGASAFFWDLGGGYNIPVKNERAIVIRPELTLSYFQANDVFGNIYYGKNRLTVSGQYDNGSSKKSYAQIELMQQVWMLKPRLSIWLFPKNLISCKLNLGYQLPFAERGVYKIHFFRESYRYKVRPSVSSNSENTPLKKLYSLKGFFASIEFALTLW